MSWLFPSQQQISFCRELESTARGGDNSKHKRKLYKHHTSARSRADSGPHLSEQRLGPAELSDLHTKL